MRTSTKLFGVVAVASLIGFGGAALTGSGLNTTGAAASSQFIGGTVTQSVTGATLTNIAYTYTDTTDTEASAISLTFADTADGANVGVMPTGGATGVGTFACGAVTSDSSTCTYTPGTDANAGYLGLTSLAVTVS